MNDNHSTLNAVGECLLRTLLKVIHNTCHILQIYVYAIVRAHDNVVHLTWVAELTLYADGKCLCTYIHGTVGDIAVLCADGRADLQRRETVSLHLARVEVDVNLTLWSTRDTYRTYTIDTCQWVSYTIIQNLI